jgi:uncharacterized protein (PEP-CTERM system associated)
MQITRPLAALISAAILFAAGPAAAQFALGPLDDQGNGPTPPFYDPLLRQNSDDLKEHLPPGAPLWLVIPRIEGSVEFTDNVRNAQAGQGRVADVITTLSPGIYIGGDSPRLTANLDYDPAVQRYFAAPDLNNVTQNLFFEAVGRLKQDDTLDLDASAAAFQSSRDGSFGGLPSNDLTASNRVASYVAQAGPVMRTHFDSIGDNELRYNIGETLFRGNTGIADTGITGTTGTGAGSNVTAAIGDATYQELRETLDSGDVGKFVSNSLNLDGQQTNVTNGAGSNRQALASDEVRLHLRSNFALVGSGGWQTIDYEEPQVQNLNGPTWYGGFIYQPNQDSQLTLNYGRRDGSNSFLGDLRYSITPLTTFYSDYSQSVSTPQQVILNNLNGAVLGPNGATLSATTGLPLSLNNNELSLQNDIDRLRNFSASIVTELATDRFILSGNHEELTSLTGLTPSDQYTGVSVIWDRALNELNSFSVLTSYYSRGFEHTHSFYNLVSFTHEFGEDLFGDVSYSFTYSDTQNPNSTYSRNSLVFSLRKVF